MSAAATGAGRIFQLRISSTTSISPRPESGSGQDPGQQFKAMCGRLHDSRHAPFGAEPVQDGFIILRPLHVGPELANHLVGIGAADVVALQQHLRAAARAHDFAAQVLEAGFLIVRPHEQHQSTGKQQRLLEFSSLACSRRVHAPLFHL